MKQSEEIKTIDKREITRVQGTIATYYLSNKLFRFSKQEIHIDQQAVGDSWQYFHLDRVSIIFDLQRHIEQIGDKELEIKMVFSQQQHIYLIMEIEHHYYLASINTQQIVIEMPTLFRTLLPILPTPVLSTLINSTVITSKFIHDQQRFRVYLFVTNSENGNKVVFEGREEEKGLLLVEMRTGRGQLSNKQIKSILFLQRQIVYVFSNAEMRIYKLNSNNYQEYLNPKKAIQTQMRKHQNKYELIHVIQNHPHFYFLFSAPQSKNRHVLIKQTHFADFGKATQQKYYIPTPSQSQQQAAIHILSQTQYLNCLLSQGKKHFLVQINHLGQIQMLPISTQQQKIRFGMNKNRFVWFSSTHYHTTNAFFDQNKLLKLDNIKQTTSTQPLSKGPMQARNIRIQNNRLINQKNITEGNSDEEGDQKPSIPPPPIHYTANQSQSFFSFAVNPPQSIQSFMSFGMKPNQIAQQVEPPSLNRNITFGKKSSKQTVLRPKTGHVSSKLLDIVQKVKEFNLLMGSVLLNCSSLQKEGSKISAVKKELLNIGKSEETKRVATLIQKRKQLRHQKRMDEMQVGFHEQGLFFAKRQIQRQYNTLEAATNYYLQIFQNKRNLKSKQVRSSKIQSRIEKEIAVLKTKVYQQKQLWLLLQNSLKSVKMGTIRKTEQCQGKESKEEDQMKEMRQRMKTFLCW